MQVRRSDVLSAWRGWRPLAKDPHAPPDAPVSRDHLISVNPSTGVTFISGGKWTTYREMAEHTLDRVIADRKLAASGTRMAGRASVTCHRCRGSRLPTTKYGKKAARFW